MICRHCRCEATADHTVERDVVELTCSHCGAILGIIPHTPTDLDFGVLFDPNMRGTDR